MIMDLLKAGESEFVYEFGSRGSRNESEMRSSMWGTVATSGVGR